MKKIKLTIIGIIALIGTVVIMPSCDVLYEILTEPTNQVDDNTTPDNGGTTNTSKGKTQTDTGGGIQ